MNRVRRFMARPTNLLSIVVLAAVVLASLWPLGWLPQDPTSSDLLFRLAPPSWLEGGGPSHLLGTDNIGRDVFSRLVYGSRFSMLVATSAIVISAVIGITAGVAAGFIGGRTDSVIMRLVDVQLAFPVIILLIAVVGVVGVGIVPLILVIGITGWAQYARIVRGSTLVIRASEYVEAARAQGAGPGRIMLRDVMPNLTSEIIVLTSFGLARMLLLESGLSFLGLGIPPEYPSWGGMVGDARDYLRTGWWILAFAGGAIALTVLAFNFLGDGLRDELDPHTAMSARRRPAAVQEETP